MASRPRMRLAALLLAALVAGVPGADAQATASVTSANGALAFRLHSTSVAGSIFVFHGGNAVQMAETSSAGGGWGVCYGSMTPNMCLCPTGYSTCGSGGAPFSTTATSSGGVYRTQTVSPTLLVRHDWSAMGSAFPYNQMVRTVVSVQNRLNQTLTDVHYRYGEALRFPDPSPTGNGGWATMSIGTNNQSRALESLVRSSDLGLANPRPGTPLGDDPYNGSSTCTGYTTGPGTVSGGSWFQDVSESSRSPCQPGGMAEVDLGSLAARANRSFEFVHGYADSENGALRMVGPQYLDADFWFLAQSWNPNNASSGGSPFTFFWAWRGLSGPGNATCTATSCNGQGGGNGGGSNGGGNGNGGTGGGNNGGGNSGNGNGGGNNSCGGCGSQPSPAPYPGQQPSSGGQSAPPPNSAPSSQFSHNPTQPVAGGAVEFWDASVDPDGVVTSWLWQFEDGSTSSSPSAVHTFATAGPHRVRLTVTDDAGWTVTVERVITVNGAPPAASAPAAVPPGAAPSVAGGAVAGSLDGCVATSPSCGSGHVPQVSSVGNPAPALATASARVAPATLAATLASVTAALGAAWATRRRWSPGLVLLFSRLRRSDLLEHPVRGRLMEMVDAEPGVHLTELARRSGHSRSTTAHHLRVLEGAGLVKHVDLAGLRRYFPGPGPAPTGVEPGPTQRRLLDGVLAEPGLTVADLARRAGMAYGNAHYHLRRLEASGHVELREGDGLRVHPRHGTPPEGHGATA